MPKPSARLQQTLDTLTRRPIVIILAALLVIFSIVIPHDFLNPRNLLNVLHQTSFDALVAFGETLCLIAAGVDLSGGSVMSMAAALAMGLQPHGVWLACLVALVFSTLVGAANGLMVTKGRIAAFVATLGTMTFVRGLMLTYTRQNPIPGKVAWFTFFGDGRIGFVPVSVLILFAVGLVLHVFMSRARIGRDIYASGGNVEAARVMGINTDVSRFLAFTIAGFLYGLSGVLLASRLNSSTPHMGLDTPLIVIAASIMGGASMSGGRGTILGTYLGVLALGVLSNGMNISGVFVYYQVAIRAMIFVSVVILDAFAAFRLRERLRRAAVSGGE